MGQGACGTELELKTWDTRPVSPGTPPAWPHQRSRREWKLWVGWGLLQSVWGSQGAGVESHSVCPGRQVCVPPPRVMGGQWLRRGHLKEMRTEHKLSGHRETHQARGMRRLHPCHPSRTWEMLWATANGRELPTPGYHMARGCTACLNGPKPQALSNTPSLGLLPYVAQK